MPSDGIQQRDAWGVRHSVTAADLLKGAVDVHVHATPHINERRVNALTAAEQAIEAGMRGMVLIDNFGISSGVAGLVEELIEPEQPFSVLGGIVLNQQVGLMNPSAVAAALDYGNRSAFVSMPTHHTRHVAIAEGRSRSEIERAFAIEGDVDGDLAEILDLVAESDTVLNTGHLAPEETMTLTAAARERGIERILVPAQGLGPETLQVLGEQGALLEFTFFFISHASEVPLTHIDGTPTTTGHFPAPSIAASIRAAGVDNCVVSSDAGSSLLPPPVEALRGYVATLAALGFSEAELETMVMTNPLRLFGTRIEAT